MTAKMVFGKDYNHNFLPIRIRRFIYDDRNGITYKYKGETYKKCDCPDCEFWHWMWLADFDSFERAEQWSQFKSQLDGYNYRPDLYFVDND